MKYGKIIILMPVFGAFFSAILVLIILLPDPKYQEGWGPLFMFILPIVGGFIGAGLGLASGVSMALATFLFFDDTHKVNWFRLGMGVSSIIGWTIPPLLFTLQYSNPYPPPIMVDLLGLCLWNVPAIIASQLVAQLCVDDIKKNIKPKHAMDSSSLEEENWHLRQELAHLKNQPQDDVSKQKRKNTLPAPVARWKKAESIILVIGILVVVSMMLASSFVQNNPQAPIAVPTLLVLPTDIPNPTVLVEATATLIPTVYVSPTPTLIPTIYVSTTPTITPIALKQSNTSFGDYYLISTNTRSGKSNESKGTTISNVDDNDRSNACSLRNALDIVNAGRTVSTVDCDITAIGRPLSDAPVYVINLPIGSYIYTLNRSELSISANTVHIVGDNSDNTIIQAATTRHANGVNWRVLHVTGNGTDVKLYQMTIRHGVAGSGGGILKGDESTLSIYDSVVRDNDSSHQGGGIDNEFGSMEMTNSIVSNNSSDYGGGIYTWEASTTLTNTVISDNWANKRGGGVDNNIGTLTLVDSFIMDSGNGSLDCNNNFDGTVTLVGSSDIADGSCDTRQ